MFTWPIARSLGVDGDERVRIAVVADDLTGALDVCAPMAARGLGCDIALEPAGLEAAIAAGGDVVCVNTASRERSPHEAAGLVRAASERLAACRPAIAFKKIDSRLKGHASAETAASLAAFGPRRIVVAPAIPAQRRYVENGAITGFGVPVPIRIADVFEYGVEAPDTRNQADLDSIVAQGTADTLFVGASGLGESFAKLLGQPEPAPMLRPPGPMLMALGSHDPITLEQAEVLVMEAQLQVESSRDGVFRSANETGSLTLLQAKSPGIASEDPARMERFGEIVAAQLRSGRYASALLCGGETAQTVIKHLGATYARLLGAAGPGIPLLRLRVGDAFLTILTKSGGFGKPDALADLFRASKADGGQRGGGEQS